MNIVTNMQIVTNEIRFKNNNLPSGQFTMNHQFTRKTGITNDAKYFTELSISTQNTEEIPFPYDIYVSITGIFELKDQPEEIIQSFLEINAVQILFPYIRSMITALTSNALVPPIILPIIDPTTLFPNDTDQ